jgi:RNA polymerase sigma factor for flagellar operon FliA
MADRGADRVVDLVEGHATLADRVVGQIAAGGLPRHISREDLRSAALEALYQSARRFDPDLGVPFEHYASRRMRGAVLDELRSLDWATRTTRARARQVDQATEHLSQQLGRTPASAEVADLAGLDLREVRESRHDVARASVLQLDALYADHGGDMPLRADGSDPEAVVLDLERDRELGEAIDLLSERHGAVIRGYYLHGRRLLDLAGDFGVSESRVCQLRAEGIRALRDTLVGAGA